MGPAQKKKTVAASDDEDSDDDDEDSESDDDTAQKTPEELEEMEKQFKREKILQKALIRLLELNPEGFEIDELPSKFEEIKVKGFTPQMCGYKTLEDYVKKQP